MIFFKFEMIVSFNTIKILTFPCVRVSTLMFGKFLQRVGGRDGTLDGAVRFCKVSTKVFDTKTANFLTFYLGPDGSHVVLSHHISIPFLSFSLGGVTIQEDFDR